MDGFTLLGSKSLQIPRHFWKKPRYALHVAGLGAPEAPAASDLPEEKMLPHQAATWKNVGSQCWDGAKHGTMPAEISAF